MDVRGIVIDYLREIGADGLAGEECGCSIDDLMPCEYSVANCVPAIRKIEEDPESEYFGGEIFIAMDIEDQE